ncbi:uncharacterized protein BCR38DRAFT_412203 [Pseudomassariella vexata]|uniref:Uncharacterized protein n=1 Tax=Pseudomassariella vexata TaxID=1141098 RepID=A0A1Y2DL62_9PEZI|nr:uncharacterized protein BCR38DRAFT_412203 [Pseudomassariella vexata]ORY59993.1 hypothetical protein BCR38DRAFT_412203 [Pseudomassariella vexata]
MRTLAITAKTRGETSKFSHWLDKVDAQLQGKQHDNGDDMELGKASYSRYWEHVPRVVPKPAGSLHVFYNGRQDQKNNPWDELEFSEDEEALPHQRHPNVLVSQDIPGPNTLVGGFRPADQAGDEVIYRSVTNRMRAIALTDCGDADSMSSIGDDYDLQEARAQTQISKPSRRKHRGGGALPGPSQGSELKSCPGFLKPTNANDFFSGECAVCSANGCVLTLALEPFLASHSKTENFPEVDSFSKQLYPLALGNYPERDILSDSLVCDNCRCASGKPTSSSVIMPLVSYSHNRGAWLETINQATGRRFDKSDLPLIWLAIVYTKLENLALNTEASFSKYYREALEWECSMTQSSVQLQAPSIQKGMPHDLDRGIIQDAVLLSFRDALVKDKVPIFLYYPIEGFIVANAILSNSRRSGALGSDKLRRVVLMRFLFHIVESLHRIDYPTGEIRQSMIKLLLIRDDERGSRSPLRWSSSIRKISGYLTAHDSSLGKRSTTSLLTVVAQSAYKVTISVAELVATDLVSTEDLASFQRLGHLFSWIQDGSAGHALAVFVHYMLRMNGEESEPLAHFQVILAQPEIQNAFSQPELLSARGVVQRIKALPSCEE